MIEYPALALNFTFPGKYDFAIRRLENSPAKNAEKSASDTSQPISVFIPAKELFGAQKITVTQPTGIHAPRLLDKNFLLGSMGHVLAGIAILAIAGIEIAYLFQLLPADILGTLFRVSYTLRNLIPLLVFICLPYILRKCVALVKWCLPANAWLNLSPKDRVIRAVNELHETAKTQKDMQTLEALQYITGIRIGSDPDEFIKMKTFAWTERGTGQLVLKEGITVLKPLLKMIILHEARHRLQLKKWSPNYIMPEKRAYLKFMERDAWQASMNRETLLFYIPYIGISAALFFSHATTHFLESIFYSLSNKQRVLAPPKGYMPTHLDQRYRKAILDELHAVDFLQGFPRVQYEQFTDDMRWTYEQLEKGNDVLREHGVNSICGITLLGATSGGGSLFDDWDGDTSFKPIRVLIIFEGTLTTYTKDLLSKIGIHETMARRHKVVFEFMERVYFEKVFSWQYDFFPQYLPLQGETYFKEHLTSRLRNFQQMKSAPPMVHILARLLSSNHKLNLATRFWGTRWVDLGRNFVRRQFRAETWDTGVAVAFWKSFSVNAIRKWTSIMQSSGMLHFGVCAGIGAFLFLILGSVTSLFNDTVMRYIATHPLQMRGLAAALLFLTFSMTLSYKSALERMWKNVLTNFIEAGIAAALVEREGPEEIGWEYLFLRHNSYTREEAYSATMQRFGRKMITQDVLELSLPFACAA